MIAVGSIKPAPHSAGPAPAVSTLLANGGAVMLVIHQSYVQKAPIFPYNRAREEEIMMAARLMVRSLSIAVGLSICSLAITVAEAQQIPQSIDPQLVGQWRHTSGHSDGGFSMTTDTLYTLKGDGTFEWRARTVGSAGESNSGPEYGYWRAGNERIFIQFEGDEISSMAYKLSGNSLLLPEETHYRLWERVR